MTDSNFQAAKHIVDENVFELLKTVIQQSKDCSRSNEVSLALLYFLVRVANTWRSIRTLQNNSSEGDGFLLDAGVLLRAMYDAYLQAAYIVHNPEDQSERAKEYLDFEAVERYKIANKLIIYDNPLANKLKSSPARAKGEKDLIDKFNQVKDKYLCKHHQSDDSSKSSTKTRNKWYKGTLPDIAAKMSKQVEYDFFVATLHGCVHSSAYAVSKGPPTSPENVLYWASKIATQVAQLNVKHNKIELNALQQQILELLCKDITKIE